MKEHQLKTAIEPFNAIKYGLKTAEFRKNDCDFQVGDVLILDEYDHGIPNESYAHRGGRVYAVVTHMVDGGNFGIPDGYCMMSIKVIARQE